MNCHILKSKRAIFFWPAKCGVTSLIEMIMHLESGQDLSNPGRDHKTHQTYWQVFKTKADELSDASQFKNYKKILFFRNPFHRILSCFFDKFVNQDSPGALYGETPKSFKDFVDVLAATEMKVERMADVVDIHHFAPITIGPAWDFYCKLDQPSFDLCVETPITAMPEGKICHNPQKIREIYKLLDCMDEYDDIRHLFERHPYSYDIWQFFENKIAFSDQHFGDTQVEQLQSLIANNAQRTVPYRNFYSDETTVTFRSLYASEFEFYEDKMGRHFVP